MNIAEPNSISYEQYSYYVIYEPLHLVRSYYIVDIFLGFDNETIRKLPFNHKYVTALFYKFICEIVMSQLVDVSFTFFYGESSLILFYNYF